MEPLVRGREDVIGEERRLLYVAMTRAKRYLYLTRAAHYEGGRRWRDSRFIEEVKAAGGRVVVHRDVAAMPAGPPGAIPASGEDDRSLVLSFSSIQAYRDCPRQYWYRHVQRLPAVQSAEAVQGVIMHETLRRAGEARRDGADVTATTLQSIHREVWNATAFPDPRRAATFERNGAAQLEAYRKSGGLDGLPAHLEQPFNVAVDGWMLNGIVDRIDRTADAWRIIDYKTGRHVSRARRELGPEARSHRARDRVPGVRGVGAGRPHQRASR
jgi:DNA helicase-2/ATP-dependent DNA helicase PcrA